MSLRQQIQREIDEEARIEKLIEKKRQKILKLPENRKYRFVATKDKTHAFLIIDRYDITRYSILTNEDDAAIARMEARPNIHKNTNPRDSLKTTAGSIRSVLIPNNRINIQNS